MHDPSLYQVRTNCKVALEERGIDPGKGAAIESDEPESLMRCRTLCEEIFDNPFHLLRLDWLGKLGLAAEDAPLGTAQVGDEDRDYDRG
jgi:hypothetical protein